MASVDPQPWAPGILVLGMHRSGTSCLASMVQGIGFQAGAVDAWNLHNARGNRENSEIMDLNNALLACSGGAWDNPPPRLYDNAFHRARAEQILYGLDAHETPWMIKDPRTLLTLGFWLNVAPDALLIGIFRHPEAVIHSLQQRNALTATHALELWCVYNERLRLAHDELSFPLLHFSDVDGDFLGRVDRAIDALLEPLPDDHVFDKSGLKSAFAQELVHNSSKLERRFPAFDGVDEVLHRRAQALWGDLLDRQNPGMQAVPEAKYPVDGESIDALEHDPIGALRDGLSMAGTLQAPNERDLDTLLTAACDQDRYQELDELLWSWLDRTAGHPLLHFALAKSAHAQGQSDSALSYAVTAHNTVPGWVQPLEALIFWSSGEDELLQRARAAVNIRRYALVASAHKARFAQLFIANGNGFTEVSSLKLPYEPGEEGVRLSFETGLISDRPIALRFDPVEEQLVLDLVCCQAVTDDGERIMLTPASSNAKCVEDSRHYFATADPQIHFDLSAVEGRAVRAVELEFDIVELGANALAELVHMLDRRCQALVASAHKARFAQLFIDNGNGFTEVCSLKLPYEPGEEGVRLSFETGLISDRPIALRFDPVEEQLILDLVLCQAVTDDGERIILTPASSNAKCVEDSWHYFATADPQIHFDLSAVEGRAVRAVELEFDIVELGANALVELVHLLDRRG